MKIIFSISQIDIKIGLELRGSNESNFILRYDSSASSLTKGKSFLFIVEEFFISVLRLRPIEKIRTNLHKLLNGKIEFPILNVKLSEHILIQGSSEYEIENIFGSEYQQPAHFFLALQLESVWANDLNKSSTNPYKFTSCGLNQFAFRHGDYKLPSFLFSSSGMRSIYPS